MCCTASNKQYERSKIDASRPKRSSLSLEPSVRLSQRRATTSSHGRVASAERTGVFANTMFTCGETSRKSKYSVKQYEKVGVEQGVENDSSGVGGVSIDTGGGGSERIGVGGGLEDRVVYRGDGVSRSVH